MHAIIWILEFMNFMLFLIKFIKFKQRIKLKKVRTSQLWSKHCTLSALDTACVCLKVSVGAVFCLDILQLHSIGLSFDWHSVYFVQLWMY